MSDPVAQRRQIPWLGIAAALTIVGMATLAFAPALSSQFSGDDWGFLAMCRHLDSPWALYTYDHSSSYFYRPNTMLLWWLSVALFGLQPLAHMLVNLCLHTINALLLAQIVARTTRTLWIGTIIGALFALHPAAIGTTLWLADRFDLLATVAVLWAILSLEGAITGTTRRYWVILAALLAAGAKETAVVLPLIVAARLLLASERSWRWRIVALAGVAVPFAIMLAVRASLLQGVNATLEINDLLAAALQGISNWLARAPGALIASGWGNGANMVVAGLVLGGAVLLLLRGARRTPGSIALAVLGVTAAVAPVLVQWPVTQLVLGAADATDNSVNLRFFYLSLCGVLMAIAAAVATLKDRRVLTALALAAVVASMVWLPASRGRAVAWATNTSGPDHRMALATGRLATTLQVQPGCRLHLLGAAESAPGFAGFADVVLKAQIPRGSPLLDCLVMTERAPWFSITREVPCSDAAWAPLTVRSNAGQLLAARRVSNLCYHYFADPAPQLATSDPAARWFQLEGDAFREIPAAVVEH